MQLVKKILNKLNGLHYPQEYLCFAKESFYQPLKVYLIEGKKIIKDITHSHLFTGYNPLIFTLSFPRKNDPLLSGIEVIFSGQTLQQNDFFEKKDAIAQVSMKMIRQQSAGDTTIIYYEGIRGKHIFLSLIHQYIINAYNNLYNKRPGNVFLPGNLYTQVQIAYSVPRIISLISVSDGNLYNLFPTDLHGPATDRYYVCSLRHEGKACKQVEASGRIAISQVHYETYRTAYSLGKNHMQELKAKENFPFSDARSSLFKIPLPDAVLYYRELELIESFTHGIHKLLLLKIVHQQAANEAPATLAHVHNCYATWRYKQGLTSNFLLR